VKKASAPNLSSMFSFTELKSWSEPDPPPDPQETSVKIDTATKSKLRTYIIKKLLINT